MSLKVCLSCRERIQRIAAERDGVVMVTWANFNYLDFVQNWILHLKRINVTTYMIGTIDEKLLKASLMSSQSPFPDPHLVSACLTFVHDGLMMPIGRHSHVTTPIWAHLASQTITSGGTLCGLTEAFDRTSKGRPTKSSKIILLSKARFCINSHDDEESCRKEATAVIRR